METRSHFDADGILIGFEIDNVYVGRRQIKHLLDTSGFVSEVVLGPRMLSDNEVRVTFSVNGQKFCVIEPFGDNSVYWIVPEDSSARAPDLVERVQAIFEEHRIPPLRYFVGLVVSGQVVVRPIRRLFSLLRGLSS